MFRTRTLDWGPACRLGPSGALAGLKRSRFDEWAIQRARYVSLETITRLERCEQPTLLRIAAPVPRLGGTMFGWPAKPNFRSRIKHKLACILVFSVINPRRN